MPKSVLRKSKVDVGAEQEDLIIRLNRLLLVYKKGRLGETGLDNIKKYRDLLNQVGYDWSRGDVIKSPYTLVVIEGGRKRWVKK